MAVQCEHPAATGPDVANAKGWRTINQRMIGIGVFVQLLLIGAIKDGDVRHGINEQTFGPDIFFAAVEASQQAFIGALPLPHLDFHPQLIAFPAVQPCFRS